MHNQVFLVASSKSATELKPAFFKCEFIGSITKQNPGVFSWIQAPLDPWGQVSTSWLHLSIPLICSPHWGRSGLMVPSGKLSPQGLTCLSSHHQNSYVILTGKSASHFPGLRTSPSRDYMTGRVRTCEWLSLQNHGEGHSPKEKIQYWKISETRPLHGYF